MWLINSFFFLFILLCPFLGYTQVQQVKSLDGLLAQGMSDVLPADKNQEKHRQEDETEGEEARQAEQSRREQKIAALLAQAKAQFKAKRLTEPAGDNAAATYRQVLKLDAGNVQARAGLERIAQEYLQQAQRQRSAGALQKSVKLIYKGLAVLPNQAELQRLREQVSAQLAAEQQKKLEQQRLEQRRKERPRLAKPKKFERYRNGPVMWVELEEPQQLVQFPWPPPRASATEIIPRELLEAKWGPTLLRDVDSKITQALKQTGYYESSYYAVPKGFAIATRIEQIEEDGSPKKEPQRWSLESQPLDEFTIAAYLKALFLSKPGYYRVIVFVVTPHLLTQSSVDTTPEEAKKWLSGGHNRLPGSIGNMEFLETYTCTALIYEFERQAESEEPRFRQPGRIPGHLHLVKAGIWRSLEQ